MYISYEGKALHCVRRTYEKCTENLIMKDFFRNVQQRLCFANTKVCYIYSMVQKVQKCSKLQLFLERLFRNYIEQKHLINKNLSYWILNGSRLATFVSNLNLPVYCQFWKKFVLIPSNHPACVRVTILKKKSHNGLTSYYQPVNVIISVANPDRK